MATLRDVAERAGVTVTTVSRMLNGRVNVSGKTRNKIENAMRELGYHPNEMARSLAKKQSNLIGLMVPSAKQYFFAELIQEVERATQKSYVASDGLTAGKTRDSLINNSLKNRCCQVFLGGTFVDEWLYI